MCRPTSPRIAGTSVSAPSTAVTTVTAAATPSLPMKLMPDTHRPQRAMITVQPESSTARPLVAAAEPAAATGSAPSMRFWRCRVTRNRA